MKHALSTTLFFTLFTGILAQGSVNHLRILNFNAWMLRAPLIGDLAKDIDDRATLLPSAAAQTGADLIFLTEVWDEDIRLGLVHELGQRGYPFHAFRNGLQCPSLVPEATTGEAISRHLNSYLPSSPTFAVEAGFTSLVDEALGLFGDSLALVADYGRERLGNGLLLISKWPIASDVECLRFSEFTRWDEAVAAKGAIKASVEIPGLGSVDTYLTHLGATTYDAERKRFDPLEVQTQRSQLTELRQWILRTRSSRTLVLAGDFNQHWQEIENGEYQNRLGVGYQTLVGETPGLGLIDTFRVTHQDPGYTSDVKNNPYSDNPLDKSLSQQPSVVDDYIFINKNSPLHAVESKLVFTEKPRGKPLRLSDHYGVLSTLSF